MSSQRELLTRAKEVLSVARESNTDRYFLYSNIIEDIDEYLSRPEPASPEPPCGWEQLDKLLAQKASYVCTSIDWDKELFKLEGKFPLREWLERNNIPEKEE